MTQQLLLTAFIASLAALAVSFVVGFSLLHYSANNQISDLKQFTEEKIHTHISIGWTKQNMQMIFNDLNARFPNEKFYLVKAKEFRDTKPQLLSELVPILNKIERTQSTLVPFSYYKGYVAGGYPIFIKQDCMACHQGNPNFTPGKMAGTALFYSPLSTFKLSITALFIFIFIFILTAVLTAYYTLQRQFQKAFTNPIDNLLDRMNSLKLEKDETSWQPAQQSIKEVADIDQAIGVQIDHLKALYQKLDSLYVTEHETGLFHRDRFTEAIKFEVYRAERYDRAFSIILIKLLKIHSTNQKNEATKAEKVNYFASHLNECIRQSDIPFRITKQLFAVLLPETDENGIVSAKSRLMERFDHFEDRIAQHKPELGHDHFFEIITSHATFKEDALTANDLTKIAIDRLKAHPKYNQE